MCLTIGMETSSFALLATDRMAYNPRDDGGVDRVDVGRQKLRRMAGSNGYATVGGDGWFGVGVLDALEDVDPADTEAVSEVIRTVAEERPPSQATQVTTLHTDADGFRVTAYMEDGERVAMPGSSERTAQFSWAWPREFPDSEQGPAQERFMAELQDDLTPHGLERALRSLFAHTAMLTDYQGPEVEGVLLIAGDDGQLYEIEVTSEREHRVSVTAETLGVGAGMVAESFTGANPVFTGAVTVQAGQGSPLVELSTSGGNGAVFIRTSGGSPGAVAINSGGILNVQGASGLELEQGGSCLVQGSAAGTLGFYGASTISKPSAGNLSQLLSALDSLGLVNDIS